MYDTVAFRDMESRNHSSGIHFTVVARANFKTRLKEIQDSVHINRKFKFEDKIPCVVA